jgi:hypothetical protein
MSSISARFYPCYPRGITPHDVIEKIPGNLLPSWEQKSAHRTQLAALDIFIDINCLSPKIDRCNRQIL